MYKSALFEKNLKFVAATICEQRNKLKTMQDETKKAMPDRDPETNKKTATEKRQPDTCGRRSLDETDTRFLHRPVLHER